MNHLYEEIIECLQRHDFLAKLKQQGLRKTYKDVRVYNLFLETLSACGISFDPGVSSREWRTIWKLLVNPSLVKKRSKPGTTPSAEIITPLAAIYLALYNIYTHRAPEVAYRLFEDMFVEALQGKNTDVTLLAVPISPSTMKRQVELVKDIIRKEPRLCETLSYYLCSVSHLLPKSYSRDCSRILCSEVRGGEG